MDLRGFSLTAQQVDRARQLAIQGLMTYQPFIFSDDFETGVGLEFAEGQWKGLVLYPDINPELLESPELRRIIIDPVHAAKFRQDNQRLRDLYDHFIDITLDHVGGAEGNSFLDVGCNTGYFPLSFARKGAAFAAGCDRQNFQPSFDLLNGVLGTNARFLHTHYDSFRHVIPRVETVDVVTSFAVLCHVSDPLFHLACLGKLARKAIMVWTIVNLDERLSVHYGEPRGDYPSDGYPVCFDNLVCPSDAMMMRSLELMGFSRVVRVPELGIAPHQYSWKGYPFRGYLGLR